MAFCPENFRPPLFLWRGNSHLREVRLLERRCTVFPLGLGTGFFFFRGWGSVFCFCVWGFVFVWGFITIDLSSSQDLFLLAVSFGGFLFVGRPLQACSLVGCFHGARHGFFLFSFSLSFALCHLQYFSYGKLRRWCTSAHSLVLLSAILRCRKMDGWMRLINLHTICEVQDTVL